MTAGDRAGIVAAAARGDDDALSSLVRDYHDRVYRFGLKVCRNPHDAADAVQDAFVILARRSDVVRDVGVLSWLMTVVRNACLRMLRPILREQRAFGDREDSPNEAPSPTLDPERSLQRWQLVRDVHAAIARLDRESREVLVLRDLEGLSGAEASAVLGITEAAMKTRLHRARRTLRQEILRARSGQDIREMN